MWSFGVLDWMGGSQSIGSKVTIFGEITIFISRIEINIRDF